MNSDPVSSPSKAYINNHEIHQVQSNPKGIFVDLHVCSHHTTRCSHCIEFQVNSGCLCNTMHITGLEKLSDVNVMPFPPRLFDYSKANYPHQRSRQAKLFTPGQLVWIGGSDHYIPTVLSSPAWFGGQHSHVYTEEWCWQGQSGWSLSSGIYTSSIAPSWWVDSRVYQTCLPTIIWGLRWAGSPILL